MEYILIELVLPFVVGVIVGALIGIAIMALANYRRSKDD